MSDEMVGVAVALLGAAFFGSAPLFARLGLQHMSTRTGVFLSIVVGTLIIGALAIPLHGTEILALPLAALVWIIVLGVLNFPLGRYFAFTAVHMAGVARAMPVLSVAPLFAAVLAFVFIGETPTLLSLVGALSVVGGVILIISERT